jgi:hypothetical protein
MSDIGSQAVSELRNAVQQAKDLPGAAGAFLARLERTLSTWPWKQVFELAALSQFAGDIENTLQQTYADLRKVEQFAGKVLDDVTPKLSAMLEAGVDWVNGPADVNTARQGSDGQHGWEPLYGDLDGATNEFRLAVNLATIGWTGAAEEAFNDDAQALLGALTTGADPAVQVQGIYNALAEVEAALSEMQTTLVDYSVRIGYDCLNVAVQTLNTQIQQANPTGDLEKVLVAALAGGAVDPVGGEVITAAGEAALLLAQAESATVTEAVSAAKQGWDDVTSMVGVLASQAATVEASIGTMDPPSASTLSTV